MENKTENKLIQTTSPHIHTKDSRTGIMRDVIIALLPAAVAAVVLFGTKALLMILVCVASAVASEALFDALMKKPTTVGDLSAVVTGLLLALNLSTNVELWQCAAGAVFAIVVVKCLFGGIGRNFANPAIAGRVFMLLVFSTVAGGANPASVDAVSSATPLEIMAGGGAAPSLSALLLGTYGGAIGETCTVALLLGYAYLVARKVISWYVPVAFIGTVFVCYLVTGIVSGAGLMLAVNQILCGGLFLGAIFMATDYVSTPVTDSGRVVFAVGCGILTFIIRQFMSFPEGVSFSILAMNFASPYIEKATSRKPLGGA